MRLIDRKSCPTCRYNHSFSDGMGVRWRTCTLAVNDNRDREGWSTNTSRQNCPAWEIDEILKGDAS